MQSWVPLVKRIVQMETALEVGVYVAVDGLEPIVTKVHEINVFPYSWLTPNLSTLHIHTHTQGHVLLSVGMVVCV